MPNLRIVSTNLVDSATSIVASETAGTLVVTNLQNTLKSSVWRANDTNASIQVVWGTSQTVSIIALPFCNLTSTALISYSLYASNGTTVVAAANNVVAAPWSANTNLGVNSFGQGGGTYAVVYVPRVAGAYSASITITDSANTAGYIEASRLIIGDYYETLVNPESGAVTVGFTETTTQERSQAGDLRINIGSLSKTLSLGLPYMPAADRDAIYKILKTNGMRNPIFVSCTPASSDAQLEAEFSIYGYLSKQTTVAYTLMNYFGSTLDIQEI